MDRLAILFEEIQSGLSAISGVQHCGSFPKRRDDIRLPAILIDLVELEAGDDPGTEELALVSHWEARVVVSDQLADAGLWALVLAAMLWLFTHTWPDINIGRARLKQAGPDHFSPDYQGHRVWLIEWSQAVRVGSSVWDGVGVVPSTLSVGGLDPERQEVEV